MTEDERWDAIEEAAAEQIADDAWKAAVNAATFTDGDGQVMVQVGVVGNILEDVLTALIRKLRDS